MTRFDKMYKTNHYKDSLECKTPKRNSMNFEGYGCIKRRRGLLSCELSGPTYNPDIKYLDQSKD